MQSHKNIDTYIAAMPKAVQPVLKQIRRVISDAAPGAEEAIKYGMPAFVLKKNLVFFAAAKHHLGFYPTPSAIEAFKKELAKYVTSKGAVQFPYDKPVPFGLVTRMVKFRVKENVKKS